MPGLKRRTMPWLLLAQETAVLKGLGHHAVLVLVLQLAVLLGVARLLGELMRKLDQPAVVGELMAGLVVGPSILGKLAPPVYRFLFPGEQHQFDLLSVVSLLGVLLLLIVTGLEIDLNLIIRRARTALGISAGGIILPFATGFGLGWVLPDSLLRDPRQRLVFCLFLAVAMSISAIPVIAKVLMDLKLIRRDIGQIILAAAMTDDAIGWILLSVVAGLAAKGTVNGLAVAQSLGSVVLFVGLGLTAGRVAMARILAAVDNFFPGPGVQISIVLVIALATASLTHWLGIEAVLGAFVVGIAAGEAPRLRSQVPHSLEMVTGSFLAPVFFASAGLRMDVAGLADPQLAGLALLVLLVACLGKYVGCYFGGWVTGLSHWERVAMGSGMNPRGAMGIIVATVGLDLGVLNTDSYTILIAVAIITSIMAPPMLRFALARVEIGQEEKERLEQERAAAHSFVANLRRVLLPSRGGPNVQQAALLLGNLSHQHAVEISILSVQLPGQTATEQPAVAVQTELQRTRGPQPKTIQRKGKSVLDVILKEAEKGFDLVAMGATGEGGIGEPLIDGVLQNSPCPTMIVRAHPDGVKPEIHRILVPTVGTNYSNHAVELAAVLAKSLNAMLTICHVLPYVETEVVVGVHSSSLAHEFGERIVDSQADLARRLGAEVDTVLPEGHRPEEVLIELARSYDLVVMGTNLRPLSGRAFLGARVEAILRHAPCAVAVVSST